MLGAMDHDGVPLILSLDAETVERLAAFMPVFEIVPVPVGTERRGRRVARHIGRAAMGPRRANGRRSRNAPTGLSPAAARMG